MNENTLNLSRSIEKSKNDVTIVFTDIVDSTKFWDKYGDTAGRLMLDRHNKLLFPVVEGFHGTIIKTIGDSIMASFKSPRDGVDAAIAMQQRLQQTRKEDKRFKVHIRIGVHTGKAIVESNDVFGDMVNVAARVEGAAGRDEILVSQSTAQRLTRRKTEFGLKTRRHFVPKGKRRRLYVWECDWRDLDNRTAAIRTRRILPPNRRQHLELAVYLLCSLSAPYLVYHHFIRFLLGDIDFFAKYLLIPHPALVAVAIVLILLVAIASIRGLKKVSKPPVPLFRLLKGGFGFALLFFPSLLLFQTLNLDYDAYWNAPFYRTKHRYIEIVSDKVSVRRKPSLKAPVVRKSTKNDIYILNNIVKKKRVTWANVALSQAPVPHGYIAERLPPKLGVPEIVQTNRKTLVLRFYHLYALGLGILGWLFGVFSFRLRPL